MIKNTTKVTVCTRSCNQQLTVRLHAFAKYLYDDVYIPCTTNKNKQYSPS